MLPAQPNFSLIAGLACLQALASADEPVGSRDLARRLGLEPTKANRLLGTLAHLGLAERTPNRKYVPGPAIHILAAQAMSGSGLLRAALPHLRPLAKENLTIALGVLWRGFVCYVVYALPGTPPEAGIGGHSLFPALRSSIGLILLAREKGTEAMREALAAIEESVAKPDAALAATLAQARRQGYTALSSDGVNLSLGVAIGEPAVAGLALAGRISARSRLRLLALLKETAARIAADLQSPPPRLSAGARQARKEGPSR